MNSWPCQRCGSAPYCNTILAQGRIPAEVRLCAQCTEDWIAYRENAKAEYARRRQRHHVYTSTSGNVTINVTWSEL